MFAFAGVVVESIKRLIAVNLSPVIDDEFEDRDDPYAETSPNPKAYFRRWVTQTSLSKSNFTCSKCSEVGHCGFSFDLYNTDGDCLQMK